MVEAARVLDDECAITAECMLPKTAEAAVCFLKRGEVEFDLDGRFVEEKEKRGTHDRRGVKSVKREKRLETCKNKTEGAQIYGVRPATFLVAIRDVSMAIVHVIVCS